MNCISVFISVFNSSCIVSHKSLAHALSQYVTMTFSVGNLLRNLAHMTETDPTDFAASLARMALPNNNQGTDRQDDSNGDVLARLLSQVTGDSYVRQSDDRNCNTRAFTTALSPPAYPATAAPLASTGAAMPKHNAPAKQHEVFWPIFQRGKPPSTSKIDMPTGTTKSTETESALDDDSSFQSCTSEPQADHLYDYPFCYRFPNDSGMFTVPSPSFTTSWSMVTYSRKKCKGTGITHLYQSCLGIFKCPVNGCKFVRNAAVPKKRRKNQPPDKPVGKQLTCGIHCVNLVHQPCMALVHLTRSLNGTTTVSHKGHHSHPHPHEKVSQQAKNWLETVVATAPELRPHQIKKGNPVTNRPPAREVHSAFGNLDRLGYLRMQLRSKVGNKFSLNDLPRWETLIGEKFLVAADVRDRDTGIISIQFPEMRNITMMNGGTVPLEDGEVSTLYCNCILSYFFEIFRSTMQNLQDTNSYAFQTDTIEKIVDEDKYPSMGVTGTTAYSTLLKKYVPVLLSITFARTSTNYEQHWRLLLEGIGYKNLQEFTKKFPGNICDFSDAEKGGFELALEKLFSVKQDDVIEVPDEDWSVMDVGRGIRRNGHNYCYIISGMQVLLTFQTEFVIPLHNFFVGHRTELGEQTLTYQFLAIAAACLSANTIGLPTVENLREVINLKFPEEYQSEGQHDCGLFLTHFLAALADELEAVADGNETVPTNVFKFEQVNTYLCHGCNNEW